MNEYRTDFLFAQPSFWTGVSRLFDFGSNLVDYNQSQTPESADLKAIKNDWGMVGKDIKASINQYERKISAKK